MEDTIIKPGLYAYQFRVDVDNNSDLSLVMEFITKYDVKHYIIGAEVSSLGKQHFQSILWFSQKIDSSKLRNWWNGKTATTKQPVSLTSAKKIKNLGKYTMKEKNFITNLTKEEISLIGQWSPKVKADQWSKMLDDFAKKFDADDVDTHQKVWVSHDTYHYDPKATLYAFIAYMLDYYKTNNKRPSRATLQYLAWKHGHMTNRLLINQWF